MTTHQPTPEAWVALCAAIAAAQSKGLVVVAENENRHLGSKFASLVDVWSAIRGALAEHRLAVVQTVGACRTTERASLVTIRTTLLHADGAFLSEAGEFPVPAPVQSREGKQATNVAQAFGSALTYARRQALCAVVGVSVGDDDDAVRSAPTRAHTNGLTSRDIIPMDASSAMDDITEAKFWWENDEWADHEIHLAKFSGRRLGDLSAAEVRVLAQTSDPHSDDHAACMARVWQNLLMKAGLQDAEPDEAYAEIQKRCGADFRLPSIDQVTMGWLGKINLQLSMEGGAK